ncbi:MAG: hypothetical protein PsegKO_11930 [Pseudohongiellaceae bacterium]|jgi:plastocyanin
MIYWIAQYGLPHWQRLLAASCAGLLVCNALAAQELRVSLADSEGNALSEAVIELVLPEAQREIFRQPKEASVDQVDKEFIPRVTYIVAGSEVRFPNSDDILHHVYSFSPARTFNIPLYGRDENINYSEPFPNAGVVEIGCNIHDWMLAYIYVGETSLMAMTDAGGSAVLRDLPAGEFQLKIWHSQLDADQNMLNETVQLQDGEISELSLQVELQRDRRLRRAPSANRTRYR